MKLTLVIYEERFGRGSDFVCRLYGSSCVPEGVNGTPVFVMPTMPLV